MKSEAKAKYLVVDTSGFIKNLQFHELAENVISLEDVVSEITCHKQLKRLAVLPYDLTIKSVFPENIKIVSEFSKKTGDYPSLSAVDMKVMALTYQLEKEHVGTDHINTVPKSHTSIENYPSDVAFDNVAGFYSKDKMPLESNSVIDDKESISEKMNQLQVSDENEEQKSSRNGIKSEENIQNGSVEEIDETNVENIQTVEKTESECKKSKSCPEIKDKVKDDDDEDYDELTPSPPDDKIELGYSSDDEGDSLSEDIPLDENDVSVEPSDDLLVLKRINEQALECEDVSDDDSIYDDDDCGWITPGNISQAKKETTSGLFSDETVTVACLTTDFAMQNVLLQMGLNVMAIDGRIIKQVRTYILRCHACGKTTPIMTKVFCPKCGLKTLKKVAVSVDPDGKQQIYINYRKQITSKGKRWSIPRPQGGKHANNPILVEDQRIPQQRLSKKAMQRTNALDPDYIAGFSPFVMRDTTSRSVMLGFHTSRQNIKHLVGRNPSKKTGRKKK